MSTQTETLDRDGFTPAEQAYFASEGMKTEGLVEDAGTPAPDAVIADPVIEKPPPDAGAVIVPDPNADPFDELDKVVKDSRDKTGKLIPEKNFRAVSEKYKATKAEIKTLKDQLEAANAKAASAEGETAKEREMRTRIDERLKLFNEVIAPAAGEIEKKPPPNPEEDIFGYVKWLAENHAEQISELKGQIGQTAQTVQETNEETQLRTAYQGDAVKFAQTNPDFLAAYNHVNRTRDAMLESIGYSDPEQRAKIRLNEERSLVTQALKAGKSPAATIYGVAKSLGYVAAAPVIDPATTAPAAANGTPAAAPAAAQGQSVTDEIERIAKAQAASKSLSTGGGAAVGAMTVETLANMTEAEFEAYARKNPAVVKELMGG